MNNLYHWHDEVMVDLEMREINREIAQANLLREAGLAGTGWLERAVNGLVKLLRLRGKDRQDHRSMERPSYQSSHEKVAE
ncbi:MAG TPA: hypothetical protein VLE49_17785 [Anaerolineales bacterium]|nr:hypothetical protein [Anaerolineales bacterium]